MEYMKDIPDKFFDLAVVDPIYMEGFSVGSWFDGKAKNKDYKNKTEILEIKTKDDYFIELFRVSKKQIIWGGNYFNLPISRGWIVWDKLTGDNNFSDCELAWTSFDKILKKFTFRWQGMLQGNMKDKEIRIHPTQKPIALYKWLLTNYAKPGYKLLDTHSGSGSFRIAAYDMGFDLDSCELDPDYCRDNEARYQNHIKQGDLFKPEEIQKQIYQKELII